jgi:hypothetical protein
MTAVREAIHQHRARQPLQRVTDADADRSGERAMREEVGEERANEDGRPHVQTQHQEGGECYAGGRPDGRGARVDECESQADLGRDEIQARHGRECQQVAEGRDIQRGDRAERPRRNAPRTRLVR